MIDRTINHIENILGRKLTSEEVFIIGLAFQYGYSYGIEVDK